MKYKVTGIVAVIGLLILSAAAIQLTSRPSFCASCHSIAPLVASWEQSSHQHVSCLSCHADPGVVGLVKRKVYGLHELYVHVTNPDAVPMASADTWGFSQRCLDCHQNVRPDHENQVAALSHNRRHFEIEMACVNCHQGIGHYQEQRDPTPSGEVCIQCHGTNFNIQ